MPRFGPDWWHAVFLIVVFVLFFILGMSIQWWLEVWYSSVAYPIPGR